MKKNLKYIIAGTVVILLVIGFFVLRSGRGELGTGKGPLSNLLPFGSDANIEGSSISNTWAVDNGSNDDTLNSEGVPTSNLFKVSVAPVAGMVSFNRDGQTLLRYVDRGTGHIIEVTLPKGSEFIPLERRRVTNTTIPKIYEAFFRPDGNAVLLQGLREDTDAKTNISLVLTSTSTATSGPSTTQATNIRGEIDSVGVSPDGTLFYSLDDSKSIVSSAFNGAALRTVFNSIFTEWRLSPTGGGLIIYTKPGEEAPGFAYLVNSNGSLSKIVGPLKWLSLKPNKGGNFILYSFISDGELKSSAINTTTKQASEVNPAPIAEKCAWSNNNKDVVYCGTSIVEVGEIELDGWFKGTYHFSDYIWESNNETGVANLLVNPKTKFGIDIDVWRPQLSPSEDYFIFINKRDLSLWVLKLE